jgi:hypothetical protein
MMLLSNVHRPCPRWRHQMLLILGKFSLQRHVLSDATDHTYPDWARMDRVVMIWLYGTISPTLRRSPKMFPPLPTPSGLF